VNPLDLEGELEVHTSEDGVSATIPLAEPGDWADWMSRYNVLAPSQGLDAQVEPQPGRAVLRIRISGDAGREQTFRLLDRAIALVERAKEETNSRQEAADAADGYVRDWWSTRRTP
jgi:hypothetical protein